MSVTLGEVMAAARTRAAPLAGESAGYLVLGVADQMLGAPRAVSPGGILLGEDGGLRVVEGGAVSADAAEDGLRRLLDQLLQSASSANAALLRASRRAAGSGLDAFVRELEAALIPVNRSAARRALSRLCRETLRAKERGVLDEQAVAIDLPPPAPRPEPARAPAPVVPEPEPEPEPPRIEAEPQAQPEPEAEPEVELDVDVDVVLEPDDDEEPTRALALPARPEVAAAAEELSEPAAVDAEPHTRPEPAVLRASLRPPGTPAEVYPTQTPRIGSFLTSPAPEVAPVAPVADGEPAASAAVEPSVSPAALPAVQAAPVSAEPEPLEREGTAELTDPMPEIVDEIVEESIRISPNTIDRVPLPKSDVNALLSRFGETEESRSEADVRRTLKEIAGIDLTPGNAPVGPR